MVRTDMIADKDTNTYFTESATYSESNRVCMIELMCGYVTIGTSTEEKYHGGERQEATKLIKEESKRRDDG